MLSEFLKLTKPLLKEQLLKEQFYLTYESLQPVNLIKSALNEVTTTPYLTDNILGETIGLISGYISKKNSCRWFRQYYQKNFRLFVAVWHFFYEAGLKTGIWNFLKIYIPIVVSGNIEAITGSFKDRIRLFFNLDTFTRTKLNSGIGIEIR